MKKTIIAVLTVCGLTAASVAPALAERVCIDWNGIVLCGEQIK